MRPVNLIPKEERPGGRKPMRSGPLAYILIAALALIVIGATALVVENSKISDHKSEVARLRTETAGVEAKASSLASYTEFANSRFDWEKVLNELALLMPRYITLTNLTGTVSDGVSVAGGGGIGLRSQVAGPALEINGCSPSQAGVAGFIDDIKGMDGVTRVATPTSGFTKGEAGGGSAAGTCPEGWAQFQMVVAFDAAPVATVETGAPVEEVAPETTEGSTESESTSTVSSEEGGAS
jgi:hypothetical protein